jgi:hypothetical protein
VVECRVMWEGAMSVLKTSTLRAIAVIVALSCGLVACGGGSSANTGITPASGNGNSLSTPQTPTSGVASVSAELKSWCALKIGEPRPAVRAAMGVPHGNKAAEYHVLGISSLEWESGTTSS